MNKQCDCMQPRLSLNQRSLFQIATKVQMRDGGSGSELAGGRQQAWQVAGASRQQLELELES